MEFLQIALLAVIQGMCELLPVSSSAHVIVAEKLMGMNPTEARMVFLLVMLHTGTMLAVILYFWKTWKQTYFTSRQSTWAYGRLIVLATVLTGVVGYPIKHGIEFILGRQGVPKAQFEMIFGNLPLIAISLAAAGILIVYSGLRRGRAEPAALEGLDTKTSVWMGLIQGLCLPFRGFSRSGATISVGMLAGGAKRPVETFSFALSVVLTPAVLGYAVYKMVKTTGTEMQGTVMAHDVFMGLFGLVCSFLAGLVALKWLSAWLEHGRWYIFGIYCLVAANIVLILHLTMGL